MLAVKLRIGNGMVGVYTLMLALKSGEAISITIYSLKERIIRNFIISFVAIILITLVKRKLSRIG